MTAKISTPADLAAMREQARAAIALREGAKEVSITVHMGTCGIAAGARDVLAALAEALEAAGVDNVTLRKAGCVGLCDREPMLTLKDRGGKEYLYGKLDQEKIQSIVQQHILKDTPVMEYLITT